MGRRETPMRKSPAARSEGKGGGFVLGKSSLLSNIEKRPADSGRSYEKEKTW